MSNNKIIKYDNNIFTKFYNWLKSLFSKNKNVENVVDEQKTSNRIDKEKYVKMYNDAKTGIIDVDTLSHDDIAILNDMIDEEVKIKKIRLNSLIEKNNSLEKDIEKMKEEYETLLNKKQSSSS